MNRRGDAFRGVALVSGLGLALAVDGSGSAFAATLLAASTGAGNGGRRLALLALYLGGGAGIGGLAGYGLATVATTGMTTLGLGFGLALGGAAGLAVTLLREERQSGDEAVTVETDAERTPEPQPADLFTRHPDPLLYYDDEGNGPVVRAANPAFEETFGVASATVTGAPLRDAMMVTDGAEDLLAAVTGDETLDRIVTCETASGTAAFRLRRAAVDDEDATRGYVVYTPDGE